MKPKIVITDNRWEWWDKHLTIGLDYAIERYLIARDKLKQAKPKWYKR